MGHFLFISLRLVDCIFYKVCFNSREVFYE